MASDRAEEAYRLHATRLWRALLAATGDRDIAHDAVAEAFAQVLRRGDAVNDVASWVWRAAFKIARSEMEGRMIPLSPRHDPSYLMPLPIVDVFEALSKLPRNQRFSVVLHDYADRPVTEIADVLGASPATVYVHLSRGRRRLKVLLEDPR